MAKKGNEFDKEDSILEIKTDNKKDVPIWESLFGIVIGIVGLKIGGDLVVNGSVEIAKILGITEKMISLTIVAFSTSLPELITSITATKKGDTDMAIGNILGSQIFNILLIIGVSATLSPIAYSTEYNSNIILLIMGSVLGMFPYIGKKNEMTRSNGIVFLIMYVFYIANLIIFNN
jgi:cation:H+ antiporter